MKKLILITMMVLNMVTFSEVKVRIHEPVRFKNVNTKAYGEVAIGQGSIEVYSTAIEEDLGKLIKIRFPEQGLLTNQKRWLKVEKYKIAKVDEEFVIDREKRIVNFYAFIRRRELNKSDLDGARVEGEYLGYTPVLIEQYGKPLNPVPVVPVPLPILPDEDRPTLLPELGDTPTMLPETGETPTPLPLKGGK